MKKRLLKRWQGNPKATVRFSSAYMVFITQIINITANTIHNQNIDKIPSYYLSARRLSFPRNK